MVLPQYREPRYWETYVPNPDDYEDAVDYDAALKAGSQDTSPVVGRYWDPIGQVWRGGKTTEREQALVQFGNRDKSYNAGLGGAALRLDSAIGVNPDAAMQAYKAYDEFGNPLIDPAVLAMIEDRLGLGPGQVIGEAISGYNPPEMPASGNRDVGIVALPPDIGATPPQVTYPPVDPVGSPGTDAGSGNVPTRGIDPAYLGDDRGGAPGGDMGMAPSPQSTIDPRYPDFILQQLDMNQVRQNIAGQRNQKYGPRPTNLGAY